MATRSMPPPGRRIVLRLAELTIAIGAAVLLIGVVPELARLGLGEAPPIGTSNSALGPSPTTLDSRIPMMVVMSPDADCGACHQDLNGDMKTPVIPVMAHPLAGWNDCTACHANDRLVKTAPGHSGLHRSDCLVCHKAPAAEGSPPPRPHHIITGEPCLTCHGKTAPLPTDMSGRQNCWICHVGTEFDQLFGSPEPTVLPPPS